MSDSFALTSRAFAPGAGIPRRHTCDGDNTSPPLTWSDPPDGTETLALVVDDPDAPRKTFVHWVLFSLPPTAGTLPEGVDVDTYFDDGAAPIEGANDFGDEGFGGPCPPPGHGPHHYHFHLYALDTTPDPGPGATKQQLMHAMTDHILAETELIGTYERSA